MTAAVDLRRAVNAADRHIYAHTIGSPAERRQLHRRIHQLSGWGWTNVEIAERVGMNKDHVSRILAHPAPRVVDVPRVPAPHTIDSARAEEMAKLMDVVIGLACRLRDEDPAGVYLALRMLPYQSLLEAMMVALAGIRDDATVSELFGWCYAAPTDSDAR